MICFGFDLRRWFCTCHTVPISRSFFFTKPRTRLKYVKIITGARGLFLFGRSMCPPIFYVCECVCVCARARADKTNKQVSALHVHDGGNAEAHSRRFGATLWVFGYFNEHALPSNFWWGDVGGSCRVPPLCWTRVDMCIYILCGILLPLGCNSCCFFFARPGVSSVRPRLDVLTVRASCRLIARTLCVCVCACRLAQKKPLRFQQSSDVILTVQAGSHKMRAPLSAHQNVFVWSRGFCAAGMRGEGNFGR